MSQYELSLEAEALDLDINPDAGRIAVLRTQAVDIFEYDNKSIRRAPPRLVRSISLPSDCGDFYQVALSRPSEVSVLMHSIQHGDRVFLASIDTEDSHFDEGVDVPGLAILDSSHTVRMDGCVDRLEFQGEPLESGLVKLPSFCPWTEVSSFQDQVNYSIHRLHVIM